MRICDACVEIHDRQIAAFDRANPTATVDEWARFWGKNGAWQDRQRAQHCKKERREAYRKPWPNLKP